MPHMVQLYLFTTSFRQFVSTCLILGYFNYYGIEAHLKAGYETQFISRYLEFGSHAFQGPNQHSQVTNRFSYERPTRPLEANALNILVRRSLRQVSNSNFVGSHICLSFSFSFFLRWPDGIRLRV